MSIRNVGIARKIHSPPMTRKGNMYPPACMNHIQWQQHIPLNVVLYDAQTTLAIYHSLQLAKEDPWTVPMDGAPYITLKEGGRPTFEALILCTTRHAK